MGGFGSGTDDVLLIGDCDNGVRRLAEACGWLDELEALWSKTTPAAAAAPGRPAAADQKDKDQALEDEIDKLTREVDETLNLSKWHEERVRSEKLPRESSGLDTKIGSSNPQKQGPEDASGNLNHVFVSSHQDPASSTMPVVPQQEQADQSPKSGAKPDDVESEDSKG